MNRGIYIKVAYVFDLNYLKQGVASVRSLASSHLGQLLDIYIFDGGGLLDCDIVSNYLKDLSNCRFEIYQLPLEKIQNVQHNGFSHNTWGRILLPELLSSLDRVIYLDADTIVRKNLAQLWNICLGDCYIAAVDDYLERRASRKLARIKKKIGIPVEQSYFNAGVLLMNLKALREIDLSNKSFALGADLAQQLIYPDQDIMNFLLGAKRYNLPLEWNYQTTFFRQEIPLKDIRIIHYTSTEKPWIYPSACSFKTIYLHWSAPHDLRSYFIRSWEIIWFFMRKLVKFLFLRKCMVRREKL